VRELETENAKLRGESGVTADLEELAALANTGLAGTLC